VETVGEGLREAGRLLAAGDRELLDILLLSLRVTGVATVVAMLLGVPAGVFLGLRRFRGHAFFVTLVNAGMGLPPVVVGLGVFLLLARSGPLGGLELLYTPTAMIIAQVIIATPVVVGVTLAGIQGLDPRLARQILALGASRVQLYVALVREARVVLLAALAAGFGAIISEVGAVMLVGGNLRGQTRVMTTAIVLETRQGRFARAIALALVLLLIALVVNAAFTLVQQRRRR
jgi:tungstate transport system permease protein